MTDFEKQYELLRITKTGSETMKQAFRNTRNVLVHEGVEGHQLLLWQVPDYRTPILTLRDPVERFRSGYDMNYRINHRNIKERYPTANDMAFDIHRIMYDMEWGYTYLPQVFWTRGADYINDKRAIWVMTQDIDKFIDEFDVERKHITGLHHNSQELFGMERSVLSPAAIGALEQAYAADFRMLDDLGVEDRYFKHLQGRIL
jgi:hypothetical protein